MEMMGNGYGNMHGGIVIDFIHVSYEANRTLGAPSLSYSNCNTEVYKNNSDARSPLSTNVTGFSESMEL